MSEESESAAGGIDPGLTMRRRLTLLARSSRRIPHRYIDVIAFNFSIKRGSANPQHFACQELVTVHLLEDALDGGSLDIFQIVRIVGLRRRTARTSSERTPGCQEAGHPHR